MNYTFGDAGPIVRIQLKDTSATNNGGKTGLAYNSSGLIISTIADNEASATVYTQAGGTIEDITGTLGTWSAPTATKCRFKQVDATNFPGLYEIQFLAARFAVSSAKRLFISIPAVAGLTLAQADLMIELTQPNFYDAGFGMKLNMLLAAAVSGVTNDSLAAVLASKTGVFTTYDKSTDSLEAGTDNQITSQTIADAVNNLAPGSSGAAGSIRTKLDDIKTKTDTITSDPATATALAAVSAKLPTALTADGNIKADVLRINGNAEAAADLAEAVDTTVSLTVDTTGFTPTTTQFEVVSVPVTGLLIDRRVYWRTGALKGEAAIISAQVAGSGASRVKLTVSAAMSGAPANGDTMKVS